MKTKIIFTTHYVGCNEYIFDEGSKKDQESISKLLEYGISDCRKITDEDVEVIALNPRNPGTTCDLLTRMKSIVSFFCPQEVERIYLILHSRTDLPLSNSQRQPIGEYTGWTKNDLLCEENAANRIIRIWSMNHENDDRGAYILKKAAYESDGISAKAVLDRVQSVFLAEDISLLWDEYRNGYKKNLDNNLNLIELINSIDALQKYPFIKTLVDIELFKRMSLFLKFNNLRIITRKDPSIFKSWKQE